MKFVLFEKRARQAGFGFLAIFALVAVTGCGQDHRKPNWEYVPHMADSYAVKAQHLGPSGEPMRTPPEGTISQTTYIYPYPNEPELAGEKLKNPLPRTLAVLERGQRLYSTYCIVCHGPKGEGDGFIVPKFARPPSLHSEKVRGWTDGRIFHVISNGQNTMPSYATQIGPQDRWAIIHYVRTLQSAMPVFKAEAPQPQTQGKK